MVIFDIGVQCQCLYVLFCMADGKVYGEWDCSCRKSMYK